MLHLFDIRRYADPFGALSALKTVISSYGALVQCSNFKHTTIILNSIN